MDRPKYPGSRGVYIHATRGFWPPAAAPARAGIAAAAGDVGIPLADIRRELMENGEAGPPPMRGCGARETPWEAMHKWDGLVPAAHTIPQLVRRCWDTAAWLEDIGALDGIATMPRRLRLERDMTARNIGHTLAKHIYDSVHHMRRERDPDRTKACQLHILRTVRQMPEKLGHGAADVLKWALVELNVMRLNQDDGRPGVRPMARPRATGFAVLDVCRRNDAT